MRKTDFTKRNFLVCPAVLLFIVMFILPFFSVESYSIIENTTSHLGAQKAPNAWMMNTVFIIVGSAGVIEALTKLPGFRFQRILLALFGVSFIFVGIYHHAPIVEGITYNTSEDRLHSFFATLTGVSFTSYAISAYFIEKTKKRKIIAISVGVIAIALSFLMFSLPEYSGIFQRLLFIISFTWLVWMLAGINVKTMINQ